MSSIASGYSRSSIQSNAISRLWDDHVKGILFGVLYAMVKDNTLGTYFVIASIIFEFLQMSIFCLREAYHWGGINIHFDINASMIGYEAYRIIYWIVVAALVLVLLNFIYIGYSFHKGEVRSMYLLRMLRWVVTLFLSVLFIPILYILFSGLACDYTTTPASLLFYPDEPCWGDRSFMGIIAIILVCAFSLLSIFCGLTYYEYDPSVPNACGRIQNRFEFAALFTKLVLIVVTVFLMDSDTSFVVVSLSSALFLFIASIITLPYYNNKLNMARSGSYAGILWINIFMVISYSINDDTNIVPTVLGIVGIPFAAAGGAFCARLRFRYLCNPALVDGFVSTEAGEMPAQKRKKTKKVVNFDHSKTNKLVLNKLYSRLRFSWDVEIAARFVLEKPNAALIEKGKSVYQTGLAKFPKSPTVLQAYANFMFTTVGDWQLGYVILEKLRKMKAAMDIQFFIYRYDKDRERRTERGSDKIGDFVDFMEFKKMQQTAKRNHLAAVVCVRKFWHYLLEPKVDVMELSVLSGKIAIAEKKAAEQYTKLLSSHPKNVRVLRDYAKFLEEVVQDERAAVDVRRKADKYEIQEMEKLTDSHRNSNRPLAVVGSDTDVSDREEFKSETSDISAEQEDTISSKSSGIRARLDYSRMDKHNSLKKLGYTMLATTAFVLIVGITEVAVLNSQLSSYRYAVDSQMSAGGGSHTVVRVARGVADSYLLANYAKSTENPDASFAWTGDFTKLYKATSTSSVVVGNNLKSLYWGTSQPSTFDSQRLKLLKQRAGMKTQIDTSDHIMSYAEYDHKLPQRKKIEHAFTSADYNATLSAEDNTDARTSKPITLWTLCTVFLSSVTDSLEEGVDEFLAIFNDPEKTSSFTFVLDNAGVLAVGLHHVVGIYADNVAYSLDQLNITILIIFIVAVVLLILASAFIFRPIIQKIFSAKVRTFHMFTLIPSHVVKLMSKKKFTTSVTDSEGDDTDDGNGEGVSTKKTWDNIKLPTISESEETEQATILHTPRETTNNEDTKILLPNMNDVEMEDMKDKREQKDGAENEVITKSSDTVITIVNDIDDNNNNTETQNDNTNENEQVNTSIEEGPPSSFQRFKRRVSTIVLGLPGMKSLSYAQVPSGDEKNPKESKNRKDKRKKDKENNDKKNTTSNNNNDKNLPKLSRLEVSSLRAVTRKLHLSYIIAIMCIVIALLVFFITVRNYLGTLVQIAQDMREADITTQEAQVVATDIAILGIYPFGSSSAVLALANAKADIKILWDDHNTIPPKPYQMDYLFTETCLPINQSVCPLPFNTPYYDVITNGFENLFFKYVIAGEKLLDRYEKGNTTITPTDPDYVQFRTLGEYVFDGAETLTFLVYQNALDKIAETRNFVAIMTAVECVSFVLIYIFLFRPLVSQLRRENEHTFSIIRMIPRKLLKDVPEIQEFIEDTLYSVEKTDL